MGKKYSIVRKEIVFADKGRGKINENRQIKSNSN